MCATLAKSLQKNKDKNQEWALIVTKDANFSHTFGQNKVVPQVSGDFILLFTLCN